MTNSPLPWRVETGLSGSSDIYDANNECVCDFLDAHIATLIVHRVNTYDALVEALERVELFCTNHGGWAENMTSFEVMIEIHGKVSPALPLAKETPK